MRSYSENGLVLKLSRNLSERIMNENKMSENNDNDDEEEEEIKYEICLKIGHIGDWILKVALSYGLIMFIGAAFIFSTNICIEAVLFLYDQTAVHSRWFSALFIFFPQFVITLSICWKLTSQFWKVILICWWNKYDEKYIKYIKISYAGMFRIVILLIILYWSVQSIFTYSDNLLLSNDTILLINFTHFSMVISAILCGLYCIICGIWRHFIIFKCITNINETMRFFLLLNRITLDDWDNANNQKQQQCRWDLGISRKLCDEVKAGYNQRQFRQKIKLIQNQQRKDILGSIEKHFDDSFSFRKTRINTQKKWKKRVTNFQCIIRIVFLIWYTLAIIYISRNPENRALFISSIGLPLTLYYTLLIDQCDIKYYNYLTNWRSTYSFRGPVILKALLGIWMLLGAAFTLQSFLFQSIDIKSTGLFQIVDTDSTKDVDTTSNNLHFKPFSYQFCQRKDEGDELINIAFLSKIVYSKDELVIQDAIKLYLGDDWNYIDGVLDASPAYMHIQRKYNKKDGTQKVQDIIAIKGSNSRIDWYEDFTLYSEVAAITGFSKLFPITELWSTSLIQYLIQLMSITEGIIFDHALDRHFVQIKSYIEEKMERRSINIDEYKRDNVKDDDKPFIICGHSLGGINAHVIGSQLLQQNHESLFIKTVGISNPGLVWNSRKLRIDPKLLSQHAVTILPDHDMIASFDEHTGTIHNIGCQSSYSQECHWVETSLKEMILSCTSQNEFNHMTQGKRAMIEYLCHPKYIPLDDIIKKVKEQEDDTFVLD